MQPEPGGGDGLTIDVILDVAGANTPGTLVRDAGVRQM